MWHVMAPTVDVEVAICNSVKPWGCFPDSINSERGAHPVVKAFNSSSSPGWSACAGAVSAQDAQNRRRGGSGSGVVASIIEGVSESFNLCQCRPSAFLNVAGFPEDVMSVIIVKCFMSSSCQMLHVFLTLTLFACMMLSRIRSPDLVLHSNVATQSRSSWTLIGIVLGILLFRPSKKRGCIAHGSTLNPKP